MVKDCPKKGDMKFMAHPDSTSQADLACYYYRKANGLPIVARHCPDRSKDSSNSRAGGTPQLEMAPRTWLWLRLTMTWIAPKYSHLTRNHKELMLHNCVTNPRVWTARNTTQIVNLTKKATPMIVHLPHHLGRGRKPELSKLFLTMTLILASLNTSQSPKTKTWTMLSG